MTPGSTSPLLFSFLFVPYKRELRDREENAQSSPWDTWISPKLFLDQLNAWNQSEVGLGRGPQAFVSRVDLIGMMSFQTIDLNEQTSQELDFRLITTSKNNMSEIHISRPTP